ncbi:hypothetical protein ED733_005485 [Metarhizium rileyi]|uniref:Myb-like DNA-binding domain-containing protein n=1 Tax=Metarhizium rileyi (strain RCEF 4871) TaxID=1649241 RepID=A0A5C6GNQ2_METRR|nr:hypothetical protein ED733_005485 [Metarhizium rileyi]
MSPNSDNAMARFLFAILKQKNLKDIDWNQVAQDPVLLQSITNGHAARMRYSRFRATVTGHEPQKRGHHGGKKRVSKSSKTDHSSKKNTAIKDNEDFSARFLTPCSDDMMSIHPAVVEKQPRDANALPSILDCNSDLFTDHGSLTSSPEFSAFDAAYDLSSYGAGSTDFQSQDPSDLLGPPSALDCGQEWNGCFHDPQLF